MDSAPIQFRKQGAHLAFDGSAVGGLGGEALQDRLFKLDGADAIPGTDGGCEFRERSPRCGVQYVIFLGTPGNS